MPAEVMKPQEAIPTIELSPERVGKALNLEADEVREQLKSIDGRRQLLADLQRDPQVLASVIDPDSLRMFQEDMEMTEQDLMAEQRFLQAQQNPEKKGMFRRAWDTVTGFPRKHPVITVTLLGVVLGVVASYMGWLPRIDFPGLWGRAQGWLGWGVAGNAVGEAGAAAAEGAALGAEVAADFVPETLKIAIFEHSYLYNGQMYTMEQLPQLIEQLPAVSGEEFLRVLPYGNARVTAQGALMEALEAKGLPSELYETLADKFFVPNP